MWGEKTVMFKIKELAVLPLIYWFSTRWQVIYLVNAMNLKTRTISNF